MKGSKHTVSTHATPARHTASQLRQVRLDCRRAMARQHFCLESSEFGPVKCVVSIPETDDRFGSELWYFDGVGVDDSGRRSTVYGLVEYSIQYGLSELIEDAVFDSAAQRERLRSIACGYPPIASLRGPAHRLLAAGMVAVASATLLMVFVRYLLP